MRSIRSYLLTRLLGGTALVLAAAGLTVFLVVQGRLEAQFDRNLADRIQGLASLLFQVGDQLEFEFSGELMPEYERERAPDYFELRLVDGTLVEASESLGGRRLALAHAPAAELACWSAALPDGRPGRYGAQLVEVHHVYPEQGPGRPQAARLSIAVARGGEELVAAERWVLLACAGSALLLLLVIALIAWRAVERGLEPARRLAATLDAIEMDDLPDRLQTGPLPAELAPMARQSDALLGRARAALERERRTAADIAHELRTPLSEILTVSEVALRNGRDPASERRALGLVRDAASRMGRSVSTLLKLARLEMGAESFRAEPVDLGAIVADALRGGEGLRAGRNLALANDLDERAIVQADPDVLRIVASNLVSNALEYCPASGRVRCELGGEGDLWRFAVENDAPGLRREDLDALAQPFWRKDRARSGRDHAGLGLALSRALAERAGMQLEFELEQGVFRAILRGRAAQAEATRSAPAGRRGAAG